MCQAKRAFFPDLKQNYGFGSVQFVANTTAKVLKKAAFEDTQNVAYAPENEQHRGPRLGKIQVAFDFAVLLKCLTLSWMKQHAQKFPACNLNGARAFHMKRNLFGDFGRPVSVSGCMKERVLRVS